LGHGEGLGEVERSGAISGFEKYFCPNLQIFGKKELF
jgi:hypothetical protein